MGMVTPTIEALEGDIFELREENKFLKERFDKQVRDREKEEHCFSQNALS